MTPQDRIIIEAQSATNVEEKRLKQSPIRDYDRMVSELYGYNKGYIAGATAEHDRAQVLVDALEKLAVSCQELFDVKNSTNKKNIKLNAWNDLAFKLRDAKNVLQQWKSGKGKEAKVYRPCPHCGKELFRDRNLCCRACGKEVTNG